MRLASPAMVVTAAAISSNDGSLARAASALDHSFYLLESILDTKLAQVTMLDSYSIASSAATPHFLRLKNGFIDSTSVLVYNKPAGTPLSGISAEYLLPATSYNVDYVKGTVSIYDTLLYSGANCVSVVYTSGFATDIEDDTLLASPDDIKQLAIAAAILEMNTLPSTVANRRDKTQSPVTTAIYGFLAKACEPYSRPRMTVEYPSASMVYG